MAFQEYTAQLPVGRASRREVLEFNVDVDVSSLAAIDIYTTRNNYEYLPVPLKKLLWKQESNPLFVHVARKDLAAAWDYLREHAILDEELEERLGR